MQYTYNILGWKLCKQTSYWSKTGFFFSVKNHNKFSSQNIVILSRNNVPKYCNKGHEQVLGIQNIHFWLQGNKKAKNITIYVHNTYKEIFTRGFKNMSPTKVTLSYDKTKKSPWFILSYREPLVEVVHIWHRSTYIMPLFYRFCLKYGLWIGKSTFC